MTDNEIIKALECCGKNPPACHECKYKGKCNRIDCYDYLKRDALDLINRLKAENKNCGDKILNQREQLKAANAKIKRLEVDNDKLKRLEFQADALNEAYEESVKEAVREFAEQLEAEIISSDKYIREYDDSEVQKAYNKGLRDALKILKEMESKQ